MEQAELVYILRRIIVGLGEGYFMLYFQIVHCRWKKTQWRIPASILCMLVIAEIGDGPLSKFGIYPAAPFAVVVVLVLFSYFYLEGNIGKHFFIIALSYLMLALNDAVAGIGFVSLFHFEISDMKPGGYLNDILSIITKLILIAWSLPYFMWVKGKRQKIPMQIGGWHAFFAGIIAVLVVCVAGFGLLLTRSNMFFSFQVGVLCVFLIFYFIMMRMFWNMQKMNEERISYELKYQRQKLDEEQIKEIQKLYSSLRELRHDMKNHMSFMEQLVKRKDYEKLKKYLEEMRESVHSDSLD